MTLVRMAVSGARLLVVFWLITVSDRANAQVAARTPEPRGRPTGTAGTPFLVQAGSARNVAGISLAKLDAGQFVARKTADAARVEVRTARRGGLEPASAQASAETVAVLPYLYEGRTAKSKRVVFRPAVFREPLRYDATRRTFRGSVLIALEDASGESVNESLSGPIRISFASQGDTVDPTDVDLTHTSLPGERINVSSRAALDSVRMQVIPSFDLKGIDVWIPVRPAIVIPSLRADAPGLGISSIPIQISVRGATLKDSVRVMVSTDRGSLDRDHVMVPPGGSARVTLRSEGVGKATVTAVSSGIDPMEAAIEFSWPIAFVLMALAGGAVGGVAAQLNKKRRSRTGLLRPAVVGGVLGFVAAILYRALQLNVLLLKIPAMSSDEAAVFAFALLAGILGIPALASSKAAQRVFGTSMH